MSCKIRNALWHKHAAQALEIALRDDDSDNNYILNDSDDKYIINFTESDASQRSLDDNIDNDR